MKISVLLAFVVVSAVTATVLKNYKPEFAVMASVTAAVAAIATALIAFSPVLTLLRQLADAVPNGDEYLAILLKCAATACLMSLAFDICTDCKETALARAALIAGNAAILIFALPIFNSLAQIVINITGS